MKPFWTSKTFWAMILGLLAYIVNEQWGLGISDEVIVAIMTVLGVIFRWTAAGPLASK